MAIKDDKDLKKLVTEFGIIKDEVQLLRSEISDRQKLLSDKIDRMSILKKEIKEMENKNEILVTEHAIIRYLERIEGIDIEEIKSKILDEKVRQMAMTLGGNGKYPSTKGNFTIVMKKFKIVSVY